MKPSGNRPGRISGKSCASKDIAESTIVTIVLGRQFASAIESLHFDSQYTDVMGVE
jgi:hypothetical protein